MWKMLAAAVAAAALVRWLNNAERDALAAHSRLPRAPARWEAPA